MKFLILILFSCCTTLAYSQEIEQYDINKHSKLDMYIPAFSDDYVFIYDRHLFFKNNLIAINRKTKELNSKEISFLTPKEDKTNLHNVELIDGILYEFRYSQRGENQFKEEEKKFDIYIVRRDAKTLKEIGEPFQLYSYTVSRNDGTRNSMFEGGGEYVHTLPNSGILEKNGGICAYAFDWDRQHAEFHTFDSNFNLSKTFKHDLATNSRLAKIDLDEVHNIPYTYEYAPVQERKKKKWTDDKVNAVCRWYNLESQKYEETYLLVDTTYNVSGNPELQIDLDKKELVISETVSNVKNNKSKSGVLHVKYDLKTGEIISQENIYLKNKQVIDDNCRKLLAASKYDLNEQDDDFFSYFENGLERANFSDNSKLVYAEKLTRGPDNQLTVGLKNEIRSSSYMAVYDNEWNLKWSKFLPFDRRAYSGYNKVFILGGNPVLVVSDHENSDEVEGFNLTGNQMRKMGLFAYVFDKNSGELLRKEKLFPVFKNHKGYPARTIFKISDTEVYFVTGRTINIYKVP